jgi:hypothetical protein
MATAKAPAKKAAAPKKKIAAKAPTKSTPAKKKSIFQKGLVKARSFNSAQFLITAAVLATIGVIGVVASHGSTGATKPLASSYGCKNYTVIDAGSSGACVKYAQALLNYNGANLAVDGKFGPKTKTAVANYQAKNSLAKDGSIGTQTWTSIRGIPTTAKTPTIVTHDISNPKPIAVTQNCNTGTHLGSNNECIRNNGFFGPVVIAHPVASPVKVVCPAGTHPVSSDECQRNSTFTTPIVRTSSPQKSCPAGTHLVAGNECQHNPVAAPVRVVHTPTPKTACPAGTHLRGDECLNNSVSPNNDISAAQERKLQDDARKAAAVANQRAAAAAKKIADAKKTADKKAADAKRANDKGCSNGSHGVSGHKCLSSNSLFTSCKSGYHFSGAECKKNSLLRDLFNF